MRKIIFNINDTNIIIKRYNNKESLQKIAENYNCDPAVISKLLKNNNISVNIGNKKYTYNEDYFNKINSFDKAYILGLLYSDGWNTEHSVGIQLQENDKDILLKINKYIDSNKSIHFNKSKNLKHKNKNTLCFYSKKLKNDLIDLGCVPNKSLILTFPSEDQVPKEFHSHFIRGYFDGDGCVTLDKNGKLRLSFVGTYDVMDNINKIFENILNVNKKTITKLGKNNSNTFATTFTTKQECKRIYDYLYKDCEDLYLTRKKEKFDNYDFTIKPLQSELTCLFKNCSKKALSKNYCTFHYKKVKYNIPDKKKKL
jgi:intein-encoded DNA endonuclease-like protein